MSFRIRRHEPVRRAVRRVVTAEVRAGRREALDEARPLDERIHAVRVHLKRARAALRLLPRAGRPRRVDGALRAAGRALAPARDAAITRATLDALGARPPAPRAPSRDAAELHQAVAALDHVRVGRARGRPSGRDARRAFVRGYRAARRCLRRLQDDDAPERFHDWRKLVKRLALQSRLLKRVAPALSRRLTAPLDDLARRLGDLHDLAVLESKLTSARGRALVTSGDELLDRLRARAASERAAARARGARIFAPRAREIRARLRAQWRG
jgi:CHAD domain-containing protein